MKRLIMIISMPILTACAKSGGDDICLYPIMGSGPSRLIAFGDSETQGGVSQSSPGCNFSYANELSERMNRQLANLAIYATDFTSEEQFGRIMSFGFESSDVAIFSAGFNDMGSYKSNTAHLALFEADLTIAIQFTAPRVKLLIIETPFKPFDWRLSTQADLDTYRQAVRDVVSEVAFQNVIVLDAGDSIAGNAAYYESDHWHYNFAGAAAVANDIQNALIQNGDWVH